MNSAGFITYTIALGIAAAIPGPGIIALVARALGSGFRPTLPMMFGLVLGDVTYLAATVLGLAYIAATFGWVIVGLKYAGAAYLLYMAWGFFRNGITAEKIVAKRSSGIWASFLAGLFVTLGNPKTIIFYLALLPNLIDLKTVTATDFIVLVGLTFAVLVVVIVPYIAAAGQARVFLQTPRALTYLNRFAGLCLTGAAIAIASR